MYSSISCSQFHSSVILNRLLKIVVLDLTSLPIIGIGTGNLLNSKVTTYRAFLESVLLYYQMRRLMGSVSQNRYRNVVGCRCDDSYNNNNNNTTDTALCGFAKPGK